MKYHRCTNNTKVQDDICYHHIFEKITNEMKDNMIAIKEIKKTIKIKTDKDSYLFNINGMMHSIFKKPKIVIFHPKNGWLKLTIFNIKQFMSVIEENQLEDGIFYDNNNEIKSIKSDLQEFFENDNIYDIYGNLLDEKELKTFYETQLQQDQTINSLINYSQYYTKSSINTNKKFDRIILSQERENLLYRLRYFSHDTGKTLYLTGPCGIGKTISLMYFTTKYIGLVSSCYINIKFMIKNKSIPILQSVLQKTISTLYSSSKEYCIAMKYIREINLTNSIWKIIKDLIKLLIKDQKEHLLILDQYKIEYDKNNIELKELVDLIWTTKLTLVVCSSINENDIKECLINSWTNMNTVAFKYKYIPDLVSINSDNNTKENELLMQAFELFSNLPKYCNEILNLNSDTAIYDYIKEQHDNIKSHIEFYYKNETNLFSKLIKIKYYLGKEMQKEEFRSILSIIPLKYFKVEQKSFYYIISPHFTMIIDILDELLIKTATNINNKNDIIPDIEENKNYQGLVFEQFFHLKFLLDKKGFPNLIYDEVFYVKNLLKCSQWAGQKKIDLSKTPKSLYIIPKNENSPFFDSALLYYNGQKFFLITFQITVGKNTKQMMERDFILEKLLILKKNIENEMNIIIPIKKTDLYFFYVFKYENPKQSNVSFCYNNNIPILYFSIKDMKFSNVKRDSPLQVNIQFPFEYSFIKYQNTNLLNYINNSIQELEKDCTKLLYLNKKTKRSESLSELEKTLILKLIDKSEYSMIYDGTYLKVAMGYMKIEPQKVYIINLNSSKYAVYLEDIYIEVKEEKTRIINDNTKYKIFYEYIHKKSKEDNEGVDWYKLIKKQNRKND